MAHPVGQHLCPTPYMADIVRVVLQVDQEERDKQEQRDAGNKRLRPKPLSDFTRLMLGELLHVLVERIGVPGHISRKIANQDESNE